MVLNNGLSIFFIYGVEQEPIYFSLSMVLNKSLSLYSSGDSRARTESFGVPDSGDDDIYESGL